MKIPENRVQAFLWAFMRVGTAQHTIQSFSTRAHTRTYPHLTATTTTRDALRPCFTFGKIFELSDEARVSVPPMPIDGSSGDAAMPIDIDGGSRDAAMLIDSGSGDAAVPYDRGSWDADIPIDGGSVDESYPLTDGLGAAAMPARARYAYASNACQS
jgi:hypothetical protein